MPIHEEEPYCHHGRPECDCLDTALTDALTAAAQSGGLTVFTATANSANSSAFGGTFGTGWNVTMGTAHLTPGTGVTPGSSFQIYPTTPAFQPCQTHEIAEDSIELRGDEIWGSCLTCGVAIKIPRVTGGLNFEKAGLYVGRSMTLEGEDDESSAELFTELSILEEQTQKEISRYKRTLKMIGIARTIAKKKMLQQATQTIE